LRDILRTELNRYGNSQVGGNTSSDSPIMDFLRSTIERSIQIKNNTRLFFLNYVEREGSFCIEFKLLVVSTYLDFAPVRQSLDHLIKNTVAEYFEEILERHVPVEISVQSDDNEVITFENALSGADVVRAKPDRLTRWLAAGALLFSLVCGSLIGYKLFVEDKQDTAAQIKEDYINLMVEKKIIEAVKDQKFTINLYKIADTAGTVKNVQIPDGK
jgi:hypothetical protein